MTVSIRYGRLYPLVCGELSVHGAEAASQTFLEETTFESKAAETVHPLALFGAALKSYSPE